MVRFRACYRIKPHIPPFVSVPVNSFEFQHESYFPGGMFYALAINQKIIISSNIHIWQL